MAYTWAIARTTGSNTARVVILKLTGPDGTIGLGESSPIKRYDESIETVLAFCAKVDASKLSFDDVPGSMKYLDTVAPKQSAAKCAFNIALVDGAARKAGKPIYDVLGLGFRDKQHLTSYTIGIDKPDVIRKKVLAAAQYPVLKLKVGGPDDKLNLGALREVAPTKTVRVDANEGWKSKEEALEMIEWMAKDKHIEFVEQPLCPPKPTPKTLPGSRNVLPSRFTAMNPTTPPKTWSFARTVITASTSSSARTAGISGAFEALTAAKKAGLKRMIGCMIESSVLISAAAHLAELTDHLDIDGNILCTNDPFLGVTSENGILSLRPCRAEKTGLRVSPRS